MSLLVLECGLRVAGFAVLTYRQYKNNKALENVINKETNLFNQQYKNNNKTLKNKSQYIIMCLGESTTAGKYPVQLQRILNKKYPNKFSVIDCGISGTTLQSILKSTDKNLNKYNPDITICMMGINDGLIQQHDKKELKVKLKCYKLLILLKKHIKSTLKNKKIVTKNIDNDDLKYLFYKYRNSGHYEEAEKLLKTMLKAIENKKLTFIELAEKFLKIKLKTDKDKEWAFVELAVLYADFMAQKELACKMAVEGLNKNFTVKKEWYYKIIFEYNIVKDNIQTLKFYINKMLAEDIDVLSTDIKYFLYGYIKDYITQEQKKQIFNIIIKDSDKDYGIVAIECMENKDYKKAKEYFEKAEELRLKFPKIKTYNLYKLIVKKLIDNNINVICMQYPVRSLKPVQEQLKDEPYYDKITFIDNEQIFKEALTEKKYDEIFVDQFAGDFGHCSDFGNKMIAKNVVKTLEKLVN